MERFPTNFSPFLGKVIIACNNDQRQSFNHFLSYDWKILILSLDISIVIILI